MTKAHDRLDNLPRMTFRMYEGNVIVADVFDEAGKKIESTIAPSTPVAKGDFVTLYTSSTTTTPIATVAAANDNQILGVVVDNPVAGDPITATNSTPTVGMYRKATVAVFAQAIMNIRNDGGGGNAGAVIGHSNGVVKQYEAGTPIVSGNGHNIALEYTPGTTTPLAAVALGFFGTMINTS